FLHTNSTSHTWPFSAIAELIDNAYDPDVSAKQFWIDKTAIRGQDCLIFMDNGAGMDSDKMYKMLSFGFSDKETINGHVPVGLYGNGFKSGSMRLGKDTIVFSKNGESMCVGLLSQTYLQEMHAENVVVPIVSFKRIGQSYILTFQISKDNLQDILRYSLFQTEEELLCELNAINALYDTVSTGTRIIIWNLRKTSTDKSEFDFDTDRYDIQIPSEVYESEKEKYKQQSRVFQSSPESDFSLRAYCSILYLKPRMQIIIRGQKVKTQLISKSLAHIAKDKYKPNFLNRESITITFGYNTKTKEHYGVMMYHKNRLIKAYERVGCQNKANGKGVGVIAVIECNFLKPTHNKQDFDYSEEYRRTMNTLGVKLEEYWKAIRHKKGSNTTLPMEDIPKRPDQNWVECDGCMKWRKLPDGIDMNKLPEKWFCRLNPDPLFRFTSDDAAGLYMECSDHASMKTETEDTGKETIEASTSSGQTSITTQTKRLTVKAEEDQQIRNEEGEIKKEEIENDARRMEQSTNEVESRISNNTEIIKGPMEVERYSSVEDVRPNLTKLPKENKISFEQHAKSDVENQEGMTSTTSKTSLFSDIDIDIMPTHEAQKQQDNLLDLLEATARERDELREQFQKKEIKLLKLTMKKDCSHQSIQTDPSEEQNYKTLYLQATQCIGELTQERDELKRKQEVLQIKAKKEAQDEVCRDRLKAKEEEHSSTTSVCENVDDEMALQVDLLLRELDKRNTECNELRNKVRRTYLIFLTL
uniref:MORC family CW-type zinc finger protein 3-like n=1 Tax=Sinocyclocheilus anshuiensis TaxID=1608454 RepID=A0A671PHX7_9TELE